MPQIRQRFDRQGNYASCEGRIPVSELKLTIEEYGDGGRRTTDTATVGLITAGASTLVAITALVLNYRGFASIDSRLASMEARFTAMESRFEAPLLRSRPTSGCWPSKISASPAWRKGRRNEADARPSPPPSEDAQDPRRRAWAPAQQLAALRVWRDDAQAGARPRTSLQGRRPTRPHGGASDRG